MVEERLKDNTIAEIGQINPQGIMERIMEMEKGPEQINLFAKPKTAYESLLESSKMPNPKDLYKGLITENEFTILFADTGVGKSIYSTQIAQSIAEKENVISLIFDLELSPKQFEKRYRADNGTLYRFSDNLYRVDFARLAEIPKDISYQEFFMRSLRERINETGAKFIVIDNLTKLAAGSTDDAKSTIPIIEELNKLKFEQETTILGLEHNKKVARYKPIELDDMQGSKMKSNLCDSVFTIGRGKGNERYIKQVKVRSADVIYSTDEVLGCKITTEGGWLHFDEIGQTSEFDFIRAEEPQDKGELIASVKKMQGEGLSVRDISRALNIPKSSVGRLSKATEPEETTNAQTELELE